MKQMNITIAQACILIDALEYAANQTIESAGEIDVFNPDNNASNEEKLTYAYDASKMADDLHNIVGVESEFTIIVKG